jgi:hypothetical protein
MKPGDEWWFVPWRKLRLVGRMGEKGRASNHAAISRYSLEMRVRQGGTVASDSFRTDSISES